MKIIDISHPIHPKIPVYPGNPSVRIRTLRGKTSIHSEILFGSHTATHIDAPRHVFPSGVGVEKIALEKIVGLCRVLDMTRVREAIGVSDLKRVRVKKRERILLKTKNSAKGFKKFFSNYIFLSGDAAEYLAELKIQMVGIDALSIKQRGSKDNRPHTALLKQGIPIFEGLNLFGVSPGRYFFVGLPLKFSGLDGAPCRAILIPLKTGLKITL